MLVAKEKQASLYMLKNQFKNNSKNLFHYIDIQIKNQVTASELESYIFGL
jgi:hypothetical protein